MRYLVFVLYAPLVSWGETAVGGERHSSDHPSKSAVIGLIGAALGITRDEPLKHKELNDSLGMGLKVLSPGILLDDYHTTQVAVKERKAVISNRRSAFVLGKEPHTILSNREYRTDSLVVVGIWEKGKCFVSLEQIKEALEKPVFHLYLGRKSCPPALPFHPEVLEEESLKGGLDSFSTGAEMFFGHFFEKELSVYYWEKHDYPGLDIIQKTTRYDHLVSRDRWQFQSRDEFMGFDSPRKEM